MICYFCDAYETENQLLSGAIPTELAKLTSLTTLSFGEYISISLLAYCVKMIRQLKYRRHCYWPGNNSLKGPIPSEFGALRSVSTFDIGKQCVW